MRKFYVFIAVLFLMGPMVGFGQVNISPGATITENFDGIGSSATATLPPGWKADALTTIRLVGTYPAASTLTTANGAANISGTAANGIYNFGAGNTTTGSSDRAVGGLASGSAAKSVNIYVNLLNNGTSAISTFTISYNVEKYRTGNNAAGFSIQMYYSTDGITWTSAGSNFLTIFAADAANGGYSLAPGASSPVASQALTVPIAASAHLYLAWNYSVTSGSTTSNSQGLGIDDVTVAAAAAGPTPGITPSPTSLTGITYIAGNGPSPASTFSISAANLTPAAGNVTINGSTNYEVSTTSATTGFGGSATLAYTASGTFASNSVWVRLKAGLTAGAYNGETIGIGGGGATSSVTVSGSVTAPAITPSPTTFTGFNYTLGAGPSAAQSFTVSATSLTPASGSITFTQSADYEVSTTSATAGFGASAILNYTASGTTVTIAPNTVWVRLKAGRAVASYNSQTIAISGGGATSAVTVSGSVTGPVSSATDYFQSNVVTGNWATPGSWQSSPTGAAPWITATLAPTSASAAINILSGNTIQVNSSISLDQTTIAGSLDLLTNGILNINDGTGSDINILNNGALNVRASAVNNYTTIVNYLANANFNIATGGKISIIGDGINFPPTGAEGFATDGLNVWNNGAIFEWDCNTGTMGMSGEIFFPNATTAIPILRFTQMFGTPGGGSATTINGITEVNTNVTLIGSSAKNFRNGIRGTATLTQNTTSGNTFNITAVNAVLDGASLKIVLNTPLNLLKSAIVPALANVTISGSNINNNVTGNVLTVNGTLDLTTVGITNTNGSVTVNGTIRTANTGGFTGAGAAIPSGTIGLNNASSTIEYYAAGNQPVISRSDYFNITASGSGTKTLSSGCNPLGTVYITGTAIFDAGNFTFGNSSTKLTMDGGRFRVSGVLAAKPDIEGVYTLTGGVIEFYNSGTATNETINGQYGANIDILYNQIEVTGNKVGNNNTNITLQAGGSFTVKNGGIFEITDDGIVGPTGAQTVTVETGGSFKCGDKDGFSGGTGTTATSVNQNIENVVLNAGSTVEYERSDDQVITNGLPYQNLLISGTGGNKTAPSGILTIQGNLTYTGTSTFLHNNGTVLLNGTNQSFAGFVYNNLQLDNAGTKTLTGNADVEDSLTLSNLTTIPATNLALGAFNIALKSTAGKTARVGVIPAAAVINYTGTGRFIVERYFPARRAWRLITAPVVGESSKTIYNSWQTYGGSVPGTGTFVTGKIAIPSTNGLDISPLNNSSLKTYNSSTGNLDELLDSKIQLLSGTGPTASNIGYFIFVRGDRSSTSLFNPPTALNTTLRDTGKIFIKDQNFSITGPTATGFNLIGNPYASPVDISNIIRTTTGIVNDRFYVYDPKLNATQGGYITLIYNTSTTVWESTPPSPSLQTNIIQSSQAFYVQRTQTTATVPFKETDKSLANNLAVYRPYGNSPVSAGYSLRANLQVVNADKTTTLADGVMVEFGEGNNNRVDKEDATKFGNIMENLGLVRDGKLLSVERRSLINVDDTLFLKLNHTTKQNYQLQFDPKDISYPVTAFLEDEYTGAKTAISVKDISTYNFSINADSASASHSRFKIVFKTVPANVITIKATRQNQAIAVQWTGSNELNVKQYELEKSADSVVFTKVNTTLINAGIATTTHNWLDVHALNGYNYFRVKGIDNTGALVYSATAAIKFDGRPAAIAVYPNPVTDGIIGLQLINKPSGNYAVRLLNNIGQVLYNATLSHAGGSASVNIVPEGKLITGNYQLQVIDADKTATTIKILVQKN